MHESADRRRFPRVLAQVYYRPAGPDFLHHRRAAKNVSLGGMRVFSDEALAVGTPLEIELLLDDETTARCWARIAWIEHLGGDSDAAYDIGLEFTDMTEADRARLDRVLGQT
jgi:c-di-GMP-binding flagellar brake protein YcgR